METNRPAHLSQCAGEAQQHQGEASRIERVQEFVQAVGRHQHAKGDDGLAQLNVIHEIEGFDVVLAHQLVLIGTRGSIEAQGHGEHHCAHEQRVRPCTSVGMLVRRVATSHEESHTSSDHYNVDIFCQLVSLAQNQIENHDRNRFT